jgi:CRP-like cAMP-binding protein
MEGSEVLTLNKDEILFLASEKETDLFIIKTGKVMVFVQKGSEITPIAYLGPKEYIGELSFFDEEPRSASIICLEKTEFYRISAKDMSDKLPVWLKTIGHQLSRKIRAGDELIRSKGIRKKNLESIKPLSIEEQSRYFKLVEKQKPKTK